jgi:hypothetical protein
MTKLEELKADAEAADAACDTALDAAWAVCDAAYEAAEAARADAWAAVDAARTDAWNDYRAELKKIHEENSND